MGTVISWLRSEVCEPFIYGEEKVGRENVQRNFPWDLEAVVPDQCAELASRKPAHWWLGKLESLLIRSKMKILCIYLKGAHKTVSLFWPYN